MKPTQIRCSEGSVNQLPPWTEIQGDIRLTPFYEAETCLEKVKGYVEALNNGMRERERERNIEVEMIYFCSRSVSAASTWPLQ